MKKITMITKLIGYISYNKQIKIFVTSLFIFSFTYAKAQSVSYTEPSSYDLQLANKAVSSCRVLQDVISENSQIEDIPAIEAFIELQRTEDGNLLIDNEACRESILEFVKNLCTSNSSKNNLYCESLGIQKSESINTNDDRVSDTNDYKKFGQSAIDNLGIDLSDDISFESSLDEKDQQEESKLKFLAAGTLFSLSPVRKLKLIPLAGRAASTRIKPVLNGALLVLATLGLSSCNDATGPEPVKPPPIPETPCTRRESGYFQLSGANGACIKLPTLTYSFLTSTGEESDSSNGDPDTTIKLKFDSEVVFIDSSGFRALTPENVLQMLEIKKNNEADLTTQDGSINQDNISITTENSNTVITISPPSETNYEPGDYRIITSNYAKTQDASKISTSSSSSYLNAIRKESSFRVDTPCVRDIEGYFQLEGTNSACIKLPSLAYSFIASDDTESTTSNGDPDTTIRIKFDSEVVFIDSSGQQALTTENVLQMLEIKKNNEADLTTPEGSINQDNISITEESSNTVITISPPSESSYEPGDYKIITSNYAKTQDASKISTSSSSSYLNAIKKETSLRIYDPCVKNIEGYFQLQSTSVECIKLPRVNYTFGGDSQAVLPISDASAEMRIEFDSEIMFVDESGSPSSLTTQNFLKMIDVTHEYWDSFSKNDYRDKISINNTNGRTVITIDPPHLNTRGTKLYGRWHFGEFVLTLRNYVKVEDAQKVALSSNISDYLSSIRKEKIFNVSVCRNILNDHEPMLAYNTKQEEHAFCEADESIREQLELQNNPYVQDMQNMQAQLAYNRADPGQTYVIDVAFVISNTYVSDSSRSWESYLKNYVIPEVNGTFQRSGVNVEFRVAAVIPFSQLKRHLPCDIETLDGLRMVDTLNMLVELTHIIQEEYGTDLVIGLSSTTNGCGRAKIRLKHNPRDISSRFLSTSTVDYHICGSIDRDISNYADERFINTITHEIGHNLGLWHDKYAYKDYPFSFTFHPKSYGYNTPQEQTMPPKYGTIMAYYWLVGGKYRIPYFSSNRVISKKQMCQNSDRYDYNLDVGYCIEYNNLPDDTSIRLGDNEADASEALQYTIEDASKYHCDPGSC